MIIQITFNVWPLKHFWACTVWLRPMLDRKVELQLKDGREQWSQLHFLLQTSCISHLLDKCLLWASRAPHRRCLCSSSRQVSSFGGWKTYQLWRRRGLKLEIYFLFQSKMFHVAASMKMHWFWLETFYLNLVWFSLVARWHQNFPNEHENKDLKIGSFN